VVAELGAGAAKDRILLAAALDEAELFAAVAHRIDVKDVVETDAGGRFQAKRVERIGALVLSERAITIDDAVIERALLNQALKQGVAALPWGEPAKGLRARIGFLRALHGDPWPDLSDEALAAQADTWLSGALIGIRSLAGLRPEALEAALRTLVPWDLQAKLDRLAPARFTAPTGSSVAIDYAAQGGPRVELRVQELFGLAVHPTLAEGRIPLTLALTSPARRPIQVTRDLPSFWGGSWAEVKKQMRGRYPRHPWPDDPLAAPPTTRAKPRGT
jgi:ATP-dependent helicase HrpB